MIMIFLGIFTTPEPEPTLFENLWNKPLMMLIGFTTLAGIAKAAMGYWKMFTMNEENLNDEPLTEMDDKDKTMKNVEIPNIEEILNNEPLSEVNDGDQTTMFTMNVDIPNVPMTKLNQPMKEEMANDGPLIKMGKFLPQLAFYFVFF